MEELIFESVGAQIKLRFDRRTGPRCPRCGERLPKNKTGQRAVMDSPIADGPCVYITFPTVQGRCKKCRNFITTCPKEVHPKKQATWRFMRQVSAWASVAPNSVVATMFEISDSSVRQYDKTVLAETTPPPQLNGLRTLLIDEKAIRKGHGYVTIVLNGDTGELLHMAEGKKRSSIDSFFNRLTDEQKSSIQAVGIDRAGAYQSAVLQHLPSADIVYDRFHLMMNINQAVDEVRRNTWRNSDKADKKLIKGSRYLLLKNGEGLDKSGKAKLQELLKANEDLSVAYQLKEQFRGIFIYCTPSSAEESLRQWCSLAAASGLASFQRLARSLSKQCEKVCGFVKHRLTSGLIEGFNNLVSRIVHKACGIRDLDYLELKLRHQSIM